MFVRYHHCLSRLEKRITLAEDYDDSLFCRLFQGKNVVPKPRFQGEDAWNLHRILLASPVGNNLSYRLISVSSSS